MAGVVDGQKECCGNCFYWLLNEKAQPQNGEAQGTCRVEPPKPTAVVMPRRVSKLTPEIVPAIVELTQYPHPVESAWCGKWKEGVLGGQRQIQAGKQKEIMEKEYGRRKKRNGCAG